MASADQAADITEENLEQLTQIVGGDIASERRKNGELVLYSSVPAVKDRLDELLSALPLFRPQRIYVGGTAD